MFYIKIAELTVKIENKYVFTEKMCREYIVSADECDFSVSVTHSEMLAEATEKIGEGHIGYLESVAIYRKICEKVLDYDSLLLHAAVVAVDGEAYAFSAPSGTGKSTHIRLWAELLGDRMTVVNGDKPIIRFFDGIPYAFGTPWSGKEGLDTNIGVPLKSICLIGRAEENSISEITPELAAKNLLGQVIFGKTPMSVAKTMEQLDKLIKSTELYLLRCNISSDAAKLSYKTLTEDQRYEN